MNEFKGFPRGMQFTPIPNLVFSSLAGLITDIVELKVLLHVFEIIYPKKGNVRYVSAQELAANPSVIQDLKGVSQESLEKALDALSVKGILLKVALVNGQIVRPLYFLNNEANQVITEKIRTFRNKRRGVGTGSR